MQPDSWERVVACSWGFPQRPYINIDLVWTMILQFSGRQALNALSEPQHTLVVLMIMEHPNQEGDASNCETDHCNTKG